MITVIGSLNMDLTTIVDQYPKLGETLIGKKFQTNFGGKGANQAIAAARLGGQVQMIGCVGEDTFGEEYKSHLKKEGIVTDNIKTVSSHTTGTASITIAENDNSIIVVPGANFELKPEHIHSCKNVIRDSDLVLLQLEIRMDTVETALQLASEYGVKTIVNPAPFQPIPNHWWDMITYLTPNEHEAEALMKSENFKEEYKEKLIITLGEKGCIYFENGKEVQIPASQVEVIDTTGAGDTFNGALAYFINKGLSLKDACFYAVQAASLSVTKFGAQGGMPTLKELEDFIGKCI